MMMNIEQVTCSPDSKGNFGFVTETFTVGTKSVQVILMLLMLVLISVLMLLAPRKVVKIQCAGDQLLESEMPYRLSQLEC